MTEPSVNLLYHTPERHPSDRADVAALFGKYLPRHGINIHLVTQAAVVGEIPPWIGGQHLILPALGRRNRDALSLLSHRIRTLFFMDWLDYDAVVIRDMPTIAALAWLACRLRNRPFVYWMSFPITEAYRLLADAGPRRIGWLRWAYSRLRQHIGRMLLYRFVLPRADHVFVQSDAMRSTMIGLGCKEDRTTAVPMGVDLEVMGVSSVPATDDPRLVSRDPVIYVGTFSAARRLDVLLDAFSMTWRSHPRALLVMVGREEVPGETAALKAHAVSLGIEDQVLWVGWVPRVQAAGLIRASRFGVSIIPRGPLFDVSSPTKLCEYLAMGVPGLVNDIPDQKLVAEQSGAAVVVEMTADLLAKAMGQMLDDPVMLSEMGRRGPAWVSAERSYSVIAQRLSTKLRLLTANRTQLSRDCHQEGA